ncbi:hypothetical protein BGZ49_005302, partial [Haplosporangium sp. Z 27]
NQASTSTSRGSTTANQSSTLKTKNRAIPVEQASPSETQVPPPPFELVLNCIVGEDSSAITVEILSSKNINALKDGIRDKKDPELKHIAANKLILYLIPNGGVTKKGLDKLTECSLEVLDDELAELSSYFPEKPARNLIHIVVKLSEKGPKRRFEDDEPETSRKARKQNPWKEYQAVDGPVDLPPALISLIDNCDIFKPEPRDKFKQELDGKKTGDLITLPSLGQEPKEYREGFQGSSFFITEQMMDLWRRFSKDSDHSIKKLLAGPMGVGKSYLAIFLAARAYAEGWPVLYVSDAGELVKESSSGTGKQICGRFFALNKDILTVADYKSILGTFPDNPSYEQAATLAADSILSELVSRRDKKTL